jgi:hypothetical protein
MAPLQAIENRVLASLMQVLSGIGSPSSDWLTQPTVTQGVPADAVARSTKPALYVEHASTSSTPSESSIGLRTHQWRVRLNVWILAPTFEMVRNAKADVARAIMQSEDTFEQTYGQPMWVEEFAMRDSMTQSGLAAGLVALFIDCAVTHGNP